VGYAASGLGPRLGQAPVWQPACAPSSDGCGGVFRQVIWGRLVVAAPSIKDGDFSRKWALKY
jgi:hypothetical protein